MLEAAPQTTQQTVQPSDFRDVIARWPTTRAFARDVGCTPTLVRQWRHRDFVPAHYWPRIVEGAGRRGLSAIDAKLLAELAAKRRAPHKEQRP